MHIDTIEEDHFKYHQPEGFRAGKVNSTGFEHHSFLSVSGRLDITPANCEVHSGICSFSFDNLVVSFSGNSMLYNYISHVNPRTTLLLA